jgi:hypothetical protein
VRVDAARGPVVAIPSCRPRLARAEGVATVARHAAAAWARIGALRRCLPPVDVLAPAGRTLVARPTLAARCLGARALAVRSLIVWSHARRALARRSLARRPLPWPFAPIGARLFAPGAPRPGRGRPVRRAVARSTWARRRRAATAATAPLPSSVLSLP